MNAKVENIGTEMMQKTESNFHNIDKLEKKENEVDGNRFILVHAVDDMERASKYLKYQFENIVNQFQNYPCSVCGLLFQSELTVRNHISRSHGTFIAQK